ncbi:MAG: helix-turn-helix domain-containing protein [Lachnospiraceae bacterium]|nr:helix-turn-helix domain-containing protein [Lachnospiraceae bacterium]
MEENRNSISKLTSNDTYFLDFNQRYLIDQEIYRIRKHGHNDYPVDFYRLDANDSLLDIIPWHWHKESELVFVISGCGEFRISEESFFIHKGQALFINSQAMHSFSIAPDNKCCSFIDIVFHPGYLIPQSQSSLFTKYISPIINATNLRGYILSEEELKNATSNLQISDIFEMNINETAGYELLTREFIIRIWLHVLEKTKINQQYLSNGKKAKFPLDEQRAKEAIQYIENHYMETITLDDIAESIHLSKSECCRCIKRCMNMTPFEYLLQFRIQKAAQILSNSKRSLSIAELASAVGFNSCSYFNKLFRKYMGCTPSQYKKRMRD